MSTAKTFLRRGIILLGIFVCYSEAWSNNGYVDCEIYPFHKTCRGTMTRKRAMEPNTIRVPACDGSSDDSNCSDMKTKTFDDRQFVVLNHIPYGMIPRSKLLLSLLDNDREAAESYTMNYDRRHKKRRNNEKEKYDWRIPQIKADYFTDLENASSDY